MTQLLTAEVHAEYEFEQSHRTDIQRILPLIALAERGDKESLHETWKMLLEITQKKRGANQFNMTVVEFVQGKFVPEHVATKESCGQVHYQAILRHILTPEEVDICFSVCAKASRRLVEPLPGWPYLSKIPLCDVRPEHVHRLASAAIARGYSAQTVKHIRNVVSAIFSHAKREFCFMGENPASQVRLPEMTRRVTPPLTERQINEALKAMHYPEKEMAIFAAFTGMNSSEISGLPWKRVNLTNKKIIVDGIVLAPKTLAVTQQWCGGVLECVKQSRVRNLPLPQVLVDLLLRLKERATFTGPEDLVLVTRQGTPVNQKYIVAQRLRPIARRLGLPSLTLQAFRRTNKAQGTSAFLRGQ